MGIYRLGENAKLYYSASLATSTTYTVPTTTVDNIKDAKVTWKDDTPEMTVRAGGGKKAYGQSLTDLGITFQIRVPGTTSTDAAAYNAFRDAKKNKTEIAAYALNDLKSVSGAEGPAGNWIVADFSRSEGNGEVLWMNVELKPSSFNDWYVAP